VAARTVALNDGTVSRRERAHAASASAGGGRHAGRAPRTCMPGRLVLHLFSVTGPMTEAAPNGIGAARIVAQLTARRRENP
jgi:hypothetical protein